METERGQSADGLVLKHKRDGRRVYSPRQKRAIVEQCVQPGASVAGIALAHGINANLVRKWIIKQRGVRPKAKGASVGSSTLLPVAIRAVTPRSSVRVAAARALIVLALNGVRVELVGGVDAEGLRTVLRVLSAVRL